MSLSSKKSLLLLGGLFVTIGVGWFGYAKWNGYELAKKDWVTTVDQFQSCSMSESLYWMGKPDLYEYNPRFRPSNETPNSDLSRWITSGYREGAIKGLGDVWMDPKVQGSLSNKKTTPESINLLSQCDSKISGGELSIGRDLAYYYLYVGYPDAVAHLNNLADRGVTDAYVLLGHAYRVGLLGSVKDEKLAFAYYLKAANNESIKGMLNTAELLRSVDFEKSKKYVLAAAEEGSLAAAYMLQDTGGKYRSIELGKSRNINDVKVLYFWNLVFSSLRAMDLKEDLHVSIEASKKSPYLTENNHGYEYDGVPSTPWFGMKMDGPINAKIINYYSVESVKENQIQLESSLDSDSRIQVQAQVKEWMTAWETRSKSGTK